MELCVPSLVEFQATNEELFDARSLSDSTGLVRKPSIGGRAFLLDYSPSKSIEVKKQKISTCCDPQSFGFVERYMTFDGIKKPASCPYDNGRSVKARDFLQQGLCQIRVG